MESLLQEGKMNMKIGKFEISRKLFITLIIVVVLAITALIIKITYINKYNKYKIDDNEEFVYTYKTYNNSNTDIPFVNIDSDFAKNLNDQVQKLGETYKESNTSNNSMSYRYNNKDNIVSLVFIFKSLDTNNNLIFDFKTYVFDLKEDGKPLTNDEILDKFGITEEEINKEIELQMVKKYDDEISKKVIPGTCNFKDCYMALRNVNKFTDNAHYYIEDGWLVVYTTYNAYSQYNEQSYFSRDDFKFYITNVMKK